MIDDKQEPICDLKQYIETINKFIYSGYVFRGLKDYKYEQIPSILFDIDNDDWHLVENENDDVQKLRNISKREGINFVNLYQIARHYGFRSRIVDYSFNPFISLYFACKEVNDTNGKIICFDLHSYYKDNRNETNKGEQLTSEDIGNLYLDLLDEDCVGQEIYDDSLRNKGFYKLKNPMFIIPIMKDDKINTQNGLFLFWPDIINKKKVLNYLDRYCTEIIIDFNSKEMLLEELKKLGYNKKSIEETSASIVSNEIICEIEKIVKGQ